MPPVSLGDILAATARRVARLRPRAAELERAAAAAPRPASLGEALRGSVVAVIAEVKRRSPSAGVIRTELNPAAHARAYVAGGAAAISVLTDEEFFGGSLEDLRLVVQGVKVPVVRKDFILDAVQLCEARAAGASAALLIARVLDAARLRELARRARELDLGTLVEVHDERELESAVAAQPTAIGVNSRDLETFTVDLDAAERLVGLVPPEIPAVAESGIEIRADVERLAAAGADAVLVGTSVARGTDPRAAVAALVGVRRGTRP